MPIKATIALLVGCALLAPYALAETSAQNNQDTRLLVEMPVTVMFQYECRWNGHVC